MEPTRPFGTYRGRPIEDMTIEELRNALRELMNQVYRVEQMENADST